MALPREVRSALWEVVLLRPPSPPPPAAVFPFSWSLGPRDPDTTERGFLILAPPPVEAPDGQGQGPQAAREHRRVGKERRGPAEVRGGPKWGEVKLWVGLSRGGGGGVGAHPLGHLADPHLAYRGRRRNQWTSAQSPGTGWAGQGLGCPLTAGLTR